MGTLMSAAAAFPTLFFTSALLVAVVFWLLVAVGLVDSGSFDADLDAVAWGVGGVPVAAACTVLAVLAWGVCLAGTVLLVPRVPPGASQMLVRLGVLVVAVLAAWPGTRLLLRPFRAPVPVPVPGRPGAEPTSRTVAESHRQ